MKRISAKAIAIVLALSLCLSLLASCDLADIVSKLDEKLNGTDGKDRVEHEITIETSIGTNPIVDSDTDSDTKLDTDSDTNSETNSGNSFESESGTNSGNFDDVVTEYIPDRPNENQTESTPPDNEEENNDPYPDFTYKNYDEDFYLLIQQDCNPVKYYWVEESDGRPLSEALYARQLEIKKLLGVEVTATVAGSHDTYYDNFKTAVKNKDDSVHLLMSHVHSGIDSLISGGYLKDFNSFDSINLDADYWNDEFMETLAIDDRMFLGYSDFNALYTYVIAFNKTMMDQYYDSASIDGETIYDVVTDYRWTLDKMNTLASLVSIDKTGNGKTSDDTYGITGVQWVPFIGFLQSSNVQLVDLNEEGNYVVSFYNQQTKDITDGVIQILTELSKSDYAWFRYRIEDTPEIHLQTGRTLMELKSTYHLSGLCDYDVEFGVLPYPMYNEAQASVGYRHLQWGGYLCIPSYLGNPDMVGDTIDALSLCSKTVKTVSIEKMLGKRLDDAPDDAAVIELVWDTVVADFGQTFSSLTGSLYMMPELTHQEEPNVASYHDIMERSANKSLKKFLTTVRTIYK